MLDINYLNHFMSIK